MKKIFILLLVASIFALNLPVFAEKADYETLDLTKLNNTFYSTLPEGKELSEKSIALDDFIIKSDKEYKIKITYMNSVTSRNNSLGYFIISNDVKEPVNGYYPNIKKEDINESKLILENINDLEKGKSIEIGPFKPDKKVGFYIQSKDDIFYSVKSLNNDNASHTGKYKDSLSESKYVALGIEDTPISKSDRDYNDIFFAIQVNVNNKGEVYEFPNVSDLDQLLDELKNFICENLRRLSGNINVGNSGNSSVGNRVDSSGDSSIDNIKPSSLGNIGSNDATGSTDSSPTIASGSEANENSNSTLNNILKIIALLILIITIIAFTFKILI